MTLKKKSLLLIGIIGIIFAVVVPRYAPGRGKLDLIRYWAATHLFVTGGDAYDSQALRTLEMAVSPDAFSEMIKEGDDVEAWNPPWMLALLSPLGWIPFETAVHIWVFFNTTIIGLSVWMIWEMLGGGQDEKGFTILLAATYWFSSTLLLIQIGQISSLLLLALVLFVYFVQRKLYVWAGVVLIPLTFKPHIAFLVLLTIGIWVLAKRRWGLILGSLAVAFASLVLASLISPNWINDYMRVLSNLPIKTHSTSTIGSLVEMLTGVPWFKYIGVLLLPSAFYFARKVETWGWITTLNFILLLTLPFSFYGYSFDQVVFLLPVAELIAWLRRDRIAPEKRNLVIGGLLLVYISAILIRFIPGIVYAWTVLPAILLLVVYYLAWRSQATKLITN